MTEDNKIDEMVDILRDDLKAMIESAVDEGIPWEKISTMLTEVKAAGTFNGGGTLLVALAFLII